MRSLAIANADQPVVVATVDLVSGTNECGELPLIFWDPHNCTQTLYNSATNACQFTMQGTVRLGFERLLYKLIMEGEARETSVVVPKIARERGFRRVQVGMGVEPDNADRRVMFCDRW